MLAYNDPQQLADAFATHGERIAAVIVEPVVGNMNLIAPTGDFSGDARTHRQARRGVDLRRGDDRFRVGLKSAQGLFGITPDLSTFGKVIGGGMPVGAFGGKREIMEKIAPWGRSTGRYAVRQPGGRGRQPGPSNLSRNRGSTRTWPPKPRPCATAWWAPPGSTASLSPPRTSAACSACTSPPPCPASYDAVLACDKEPSTASSTPCSTPATASPPSAFEAGFVSAAHSDADIAATVAAAAAYFALGTDKG